MRRLPLLLLALVLAAPVAAPAPPAPRARNVVVMIADGAGYTTWEATAMYRGHAPAFLDEEGWVRVPKACGSAGKAYDPEKAWDGYTWLRATAPDSAATMTAMMTGAKTLDGRIDVDPQGKPLVTLAEIAHEAGLAAGAITTVPLSHATPASGGGAHALSRNDYAGIANEMLDADVLTVLMGAGHPGYDDDANPVADPPAKRYGYVGGPETWRALVAGTHPGDWTLATEAREFAALAACGRLPDGTRPARLIGVPRVHTTLQEKRKPWPAPDDPPFATPGNAGVPDLATMTRGALNLLADDPDGFFLVVEGGAVDWGLHANRLGRTVEEMLGFLAAARAVVEFVESHGGWERNLVILTADHDHLLLGPDAATKPFDALVDRGPGKLSGHAFVGNGHSNRLVPLYARGPGAERFRELAAGRDPVRGEYVEDTSVFTVVQELIAPPKAAKTR